MEHVYTREALENITKIHFVYSNHLGWMCACDIAWKSLTYGFENVIGVDVSRWEKFHCDHLPVKLIGNLGTYLSTKKGKNQTGTQSSRIWK